MASRSGALVPSSHGERRRAADRRSERLFKVTGAIADAITPEEVYQAVVNEVAGALGASSAGLWLLDADGRSARLARAYGYDENASQRFESVPLEGGANRVPVLDALITARPIFFDSQESLLESYPNLNSVVSPERAYRVACLPVTVHGRRLGALGLTFEGGASIDPDERQFLLLVARYSGQALERLRLLEAETASRAQAEMLHWLAAEVIRAERVEDVFEATLETVHRLVGAERSAVLVADEQGIMRFRAWRGLSDAYRRSVEGHSPWMPGERAPKPVIIEDVEADPAVAPLISILRREGIGALAFIPLVASSRLIGKFMVYYARPRGLSAQELGVTCTIANHVAVAVTRFAAMDQLQQTVRFNEMFTAILGHDLRNPLAAIMTAGQLLLVRDDNANAIKPLTRIVKSGARMARMIDQLLDFTRTRVGAGIPLEVGRVDAVALCRQIIDELDDANPAWTLRLAHTGDTRGVWDDDRLCQVLSNLIGNAIQHGQAEHGVQVKVDGSDPGSVAITVHNMGAVPAELLGTLFDPMTGGEHRRENSHGIGLGLYISREIARAHGGRIDVRSDEDQGTTFTLCLPREPRP